jgi:hypothetical protein
MFALHNHGIGPHSRLGWKLSSETNFILRYQQVENATDRRIRHGSEV